MPTTPPARPDSAPVPLVGRDLDAVLLDVGGVLTVPDPVAIGTTLAGVGVEAGIPALVRAHYVGMRAHAGCDGDGDRPWRAYIAAYLTEAGVAPAEMGEASRAFARVFGHHVWRHPLMESVAAMALMSERGAPLGIVSNANGQIEGTIANLSICQVGPGGGVPVEIVVDSAVVGVEKPDPAIFAPAVDVLAGLGISTDRTAFVGDSVHYDLGGARAAGLVPVLLDPFDLHGDMDLGAGAHRIGSLHDLLPPS